MSLKSEDLGKTQVLVTMDATNDGCDNLCLILKIAQLLEFFTIKITQNLL